MTRSTKEKRQQTQLIDNVVENSTLNKTTVLENVSKEVSAIFMKAQEEESHYRSESVRLRNVQLACCLNSPRIIDQPEDIDTEGEREFTKAVLNMVNKLLKVKRGEDAGDRSGNFIGNFLKYIQERDTFAQAESRKAKRKAMKKANRQAEMEARGDNDEMDIDDQEEKEEESDEEEEGEDQEEEEEDDEEEALETISSRFTEALLRHLLKGFTADNTTVRIRSCQIIAESIRNMGEIDEGLYQDLRQALIERLHDKDSSVRLPTANALCRLNVADTDVDEKDGKTITQKLLWSMQHDPHSEVRRIIIFQIPVTVETLPYIVDQARDVDSFNRKMVYSKPLSEISDFRILSFEDRNKAILWGLKDRVKSVRKAASTMLYKEWMGHADHNLIEFLERLEILRPGVTEVAELVLNAFFEIRLDVVANMKFDVEFWKNLIPESAFLYKTLIKFLQKDTKLHERLDDILPELSFHVVNIKYYHDVYRGTPAQEEAYQFVTTQMLEIALYLDYADEAGRRKMFELLRDMLTLHELVDDHLINVIRIFRLISLDERDFTRSMIEVISDIQEQITQTEDLEETPAKRLKLNLNALTLDNPSLSDTEPTSSDQKTSTELNITDRVLQVRCLNICRLMLENIDKPLTENSSLYGLLNDLVIPAVFTLDHTLREEALHCLALFCLIDKPLAQQNISLFIDSIISGRESGVTTSVRAIFDLMIKYGAQDLTSTQTKIEDIKQVLEFCLDHDDSEIQAITALGLSKLMLTNRFADVELLRLMILLYFFPTKVEVNSKLQQCLSYFFSVYSYSSPIHQKAVADVAISVLEELCITFIDLEKDESMVKPQAIAEMLVDWTDPRKLAKKYLEEEEGLASDIPSTLAIQALNFIYEEPTGFKRKTMCQFFLKLNLEQQSHENRTAITELIQKIEDERPIKEIPFKKAILKRCISE